MFPPSHRRGLCHCSAVADRCWTDFRLAIFSKRRYPSYKQNSRIKTLKSASRNGCTVLWGEGSEVRQMVSEESSGFLSRVALSGIRFTVHSFEQLPARRDMVIGWFLAEGISSRSSVG